MSSLSALNPHFRLNLARLSAIGGFAVILVLLGFLVPFWIVLTISSALVLITAMVRALRRASSTVERILAEELSRD
jgi:multisubunit Na+/H+ antiporter MnhE subunit